MSDLLARLAPALAGRYRLERELGQGGMATVFLAEDERHRRHVAIKVFSPDLSAILGQERFLKEIEVTAGLQHPHILPLFDSGSADGLLYYVMPFVEGETLRGRLDRETQLPVADAVRLASEVAAALDYAHKRGVVHRDIKPENVLLQDGRALVADFGIALAVQEAGGQRITQTGMSLGTPHYMAPEQAMGEKVIDARADLFSLGAMTYEMLAGEPPFTAPTMQGVVAKVLSAEPAPLASVRKSVPAHVAAAVAACLEKLPADRPSSAAAFAASLSGAQGTTTTGSTMHRRPGPPRGLLLAGMAMVAVVAVVAIAAWSALRGRAPAADSASGAGLARFLFTPPDSIELQAVCCGQMMALSPDGGTLVFQGLPRSGTAGSMRLYVRDLSDLSVRPLAGTDSATSLSISPDGTQLAFVVQRRLMRTSLRSGTPETVVSLPAGYVGGTAWLSNDRLVVAVGSTLHEVDAMRGTLTTLAGPDSSGRQVTGPSVVPGKGVLFAYATRDQVPIVYWLPLGKGAAKMVRPGATPRYIPAWRRLVLLESQSLLALPFDPATGDTTGPAIRIATGVAARSPVVAHAEYTASDQGTLVMARRKGGIGLSTLTLRLDGRDTTISVLDRAVLTELRASPDNQRFVVSVGLDGNFSMQGRAVYTYDVARGVAQMVAKDSGARDASWTDRGDSLVYRDAVGTHFMIRAADGSGVHRDLFTLKAWTNILGYSMRGPWFVLAGSATPGQARADLGFTHRDSAGVVHALTSTPEHEETDPALSPDGHWIAYTSDETGTLEVYVSPFPVPTSRLLVSHGGGHFPTWSGDGRTLYYANEPQFFAVPFAVGPDGRPSLGESREVHRRASVRWWAVSPDGSRFGFIDTMRLLELQGFEVVLNASPEQLAR